MGDVSSSVFGSRIEISKNRKKLSQVKKLNLIALFLQSLDDFDFGDNGRTLPRPETAWLYQNNGTPLEKILIYFDL